MKQSRFTTEQIIAVLKRADAGETIVDICREVGISDTTFARWRAKYGGMEVSDAQRLRTLEAENRRLKQLLAETMLDNAALKDVLGKKLVKPADRRQVVAYLVTHHRFSERRACQLVQLARGTMRYRAQPRDETALRARLRALAQERLRFGYRRLTVLLRREFGAVNHKRVHRLYCAEGLRVRRRVRKRVAATSRPVRAEPTTIGTAWSVDFTHDTLAGGRTFRTLNIIDRVSRVCHAITVDTSVPSLRVIREFERVAARVGQPIEIRVDNGPEFISQALDTWAAGRGITLDFTRPGKPTDNGHSESFNGKFRDECLNQHWFLTLDDARRLIEAWRVDYNSVRPHSALGNLTPQAYCAQQQSRPPHSGWTC
ncbi:MAG TPA: IS3 family transposase [Herpetosiphonaceae bacterium]